MKLHLPTMLRKALLAAVAASFAYASTAQAETTNYEKEGNCCDWSDEVEGDIVGQHVYLEDFSLTVTDGVGITTEEEPGDVNVSGSIKLKDAEGDTACSTTSDPNHQHVAQSNNSTSTHVGCYHTTPTQLLVDGAVSAGVDISINGGTLTSGGSTTAGHDIILNSTATGVTGTPSLTSISGGIEAGNDIIVNAGEVKTTTGSIEAGGNINAAGGTIHSDNSSIKAGTGVIVSGSGSITSGLGGISTTTGDINVASGTINVGGSQQALAGDIIVGHVTEKDGVTTSTKGSNTASSQEATDIIVQGTGSTNTVTTGAQTATTGSITVGADAENKVANGQTAQQSISVSGSNTVYAGVQTATTGDIYVSGSNTVTQGSQSAAGIISIAGTNSAKGQTAAGLEVTGTNTSTLGQTISGDIIVNTTHAPASEDGKTPESGFNKVTGTQQGTSITVAKGLNTVSGAQTTKVEGLTGSIIVGTEKGTGTNTAVNEAQTQTSSADIIVYGDGKNTIAGSQSATGNITVDGTNSAKTQSAASLDVTGTNTITGDQIITGTINVSGTNKVEYGQTATTGNIEVTGTNWVGKTDTTTSANRDQHAMDGSIVVSGGENIVTGNQVADSATSEYPDGHDILVQADGNQLSVNKVTGDQIASGDINMSGMGNGTKKDGDVAISTTGGMQQAGHDIVLGSGALTVGEYQQAGNSIEITGTKLTVNGTSTTQDAKEGGNTVSQYAEKGSIEIKGNADVELVKGGQTAAGSIAVTGSQLTIADGNQTAKGTDSGDTDAIELKNAGVYIDGSQTATAGSIDISGKANYVASTGEEGTGTTITGDQEAQKSIKVTNDAVVDIKGTQTATTGSITVTESKLTVGIDETHPESMQSQTASGAIAITASGVHIKGNQVSQQDSITITGQKLVGTDSEGNPIYEGTQVDGSQTADVNITIQEQTTKTEPLTTADGKKVDIVTGVVSADVDVEFDQTAKKGAITVSASDLEVGWNQTAGTNITIGAVEKYTEVDTDEDADPDTWIPELVRSTVTVGGNQTATTGTIDITSADVTVGGNQWALGNITIGTDDGGTAYAESATIANAYEPASVKYEQTAKQSTVTINGTQTSKDGGISVTNSILSVGKDAANVGTDQELQSQTAKKTINITDSDVLVKGVQLSEEGDIIITGKLDNDGTDVLDDQIAAGGIQITGGADVVVGGDQIAHGDTSTFAKLTDITVTNSGLFVGGKQQAEKGDIVISGKGTWTDDTGSDAIPATGTGTDIVGAQLASGGIDISNGADVVVGGDQIASGTEGDLKDITVTNSGLFVGGNQVAEKGSILISGTGDDTWTNDTGLTGIPTSGTGVDIAGYQWATKDITISEYSDVAVGGSQLAYGTISVTGGSVLYVGENQMAMGGITISDSVGMWTNNLGNTTVTGYGTDVVGNQWTLDSITLSGSDVSIGGNQTAWGLDTPADPETNTLAQAVIDVTNTGLYVGGDQTAWKGSINIENTTGDALTWTNETGVGPQTTTTNPGHGVDIAGTQWAGKDITMKSSDVWIGESQLAYGNIGSTSTGLCVQDDQMAMGNISIISSTTTTAWTMFNNGTEVTGHGTDIVGSQWAGKDIELKSSDVVIGESQTALGNISSDKTGLYVDGDQTAWKGSIAITGTGNWTNDYQDTETVEGITTVLDPAGGKGTDIAGNQTAWGGITIKADAKNPDSPVAADVTVGGDQTAVVGDITVTNSGLTVGDDQTSVYGSIVITGVKDSTKEYVANDGTTKTSTNQRIEIGGNQTAGQHITLTNTSVNVGESGTAGTYVDIDNTIADYGENLTAKGENDADGTAIRITGSTVNVTQDVTAQDSNNVIHIEMSQTDPSKHSTVTVGGVITAKDGQLLVGNESDSTLNPAGGTGTPTASTLHLTGTAMGDRESLIQKDIDTITVHDNNLIDADNTVLTVGTELTVEGTIDGTAWSNIDGVNTVTGSHVPATNDNGELVFDEDGKPVYDTVKEGTITATEKVVLTGANTITDAVITATGPLSETLVPDVTIASTERVNWGWFGTTAQPTVITGSTITSAGTMTIAGTGEHNRAEITDDDVNDYLTTIKSVRNMTLSSVDIRDLDKAVTSTAGDIKLAGSSYITGSTLAVASGSAAYTTGTLNGGAGKPNTATQLIDLQSWAYLQAGEKMVFDGKLASTDTTAIIEKTGGDTLKLNYDATGYNGAINVNVHNTAHRHEEPDHAATAFWWNPGMADDDDGSDLVINCEGLGKNSVVNMSDSNLYFTKEAFTGYPTTADPTVEEVTEAQFGTINTSYDLGSRKVGVAHDVNVRATDYGTLAESTDYIEDETGLTTALSYTDDGNTRYGFKTEDIGTIIAANTKSATNAGIAGDVLKGTAMDLAAPTMLVIDGKLTDDLTSPDYRKNVTLDTYELSGTLQGNGARVFVKTDKDDDLNKVVFEDQTSKAFITTKPGSAYTKLEEDLLFNVHYDAANGTYQRDMQQMNAWVRTTDKGAEIVYSRNYITAEGKDYNQGEVAGALAQLSKRHNHTEDTLWQGNPNATRFENLLDAFDYTRSEGAALAGLTSVSGATSTIAQHSVMESSRHHLDTLRQWIDMPTCPEQQPVVADDGKEMTMTMRQPVDTKSNVWATYTGGYDMIDEDSVLMDGYTRTYQGALMGYSREVNCKLLLGIALGYENSVAHSEDTHVHGDTYMFDLYGSARTGKFNHRFSVGMGIHRFAEQRGVHVIAENGHTFSGNGFSDYRAKSINVGYELSRDFQVTERSTVSPYLAVNYAYHWFGELEEQGMGDAGLVTDLEAMNQLEVAAGARYAYSFGLVKDQAPATFFASAELKAEFTDHEPTARHYFKAHEDIDWHTKSIERSPFYGEIGVGLTVPFAERWSGTVSASYEFGSSRDSINAGAGVHYSF